MRTITGGKEPWPAPGRAGDSARDRREACIGPALPVEAIADDRDGVAPALVVANQHRAGLEVTLWCCTLSRQAVQEAEAFAIEAAERPFLDATGNHVSEQ